MRSGLALILALAGSGAWLAPARSAAQPFENEPLRVEEGAVVVARFAAPDERIGSLRARRLSSRRRAERDGRDAIHRFVDEALDQVMAQPDVAERAHAAVEGEAVAVRVRPLVDASSVVQLSLPVEALRAVAPLEGVPW